MGERENMKEKIVSCAMELFYNRSYHEVTVDDIIEASQTSKGGFYYYFKSKEELLLCWLPKQDKEYEEWYEKADKEQPSLELLLKFSKFVLRTIECSYTPEILTIVYSAQLKLKGKDRIYDSDRRLYRIIYDIIRRGQERLEIDDTYSCKELGKMIVTVFRGCIYEWNLNDGASSLEEYGGRMIKYLISSFAV